MKKQLTNSEVRELADKWPFIDRKARVFVEEAAGAQLYYIDDRLMLISNRGRTFPSLRADTSAMARAVIDMGAVPFVCKGADVMRPGVKEMGDFAKGDLLVIVDEKNRKPLAIAEALVDSVEAKAASSGKIFKNLHYVGDAWWSK